MAAVGVFNGIRVQHWDARGPFKGGIRYYPNITLDEVTALGDVDDLEMRDCGYTVMAEPKAGVCVDTKKMSKHELESANPKIRQPNLSITLDPTETSQRLTCTRTRKPWRG